MTAALTGGLQLEIGGRRFPVASLADASEKWLAVIAAAGTGGSATPTPFILDGQGRRIAHISYNGRVWAGDPRDWQPGTRPIHDNRTAETTP